MSELAQRHHLDLRGYKRSTLFRRTHRRMAQMRVQDYAEYLQFILEHPGEVNELLHTVLINVTKFFRDPAAWEVLRTEALPLMLENHSPGEPLKLWSVGCSTGEEPFSLALMLAHHLGPRLAEYEVKIYASDQDDRALQIARKAVYPNEALPYIPQRYHDALIRGPETFSLAREVRKLVIFGRSNIVTDAPITHVDLLVCRNMLIYFDPPAQRHILNKLDCAVEPGGILFLGKSESQLRNNAFFQPLNVRWRLFTRTQAASKLERIPSMSAESKQPSYLNDRVQEELSILRLYHDAVLQTLEPAVVLIDVSGRIVSENDSVRRLMQLERKMQGGQVSESAIMQKCPELEPHLAAANGIDHKTARFECTSPEGKLLAVTVRPVLTEPGKELIGTLIYMEDISPKENLQQTIEELQSTAEELQSSNEELETTNEELQSTNEELETTNEELQSTNEELETTNEELKSLNEELEDINDELGKRSRELDDLNEHYAQLVERMPWPMFLVTPGGKVQLFNTAAQKLFGFATPVPMSMSLNEVPMSHANRARIQEEIAQARESNSAAVVGMGKLSTNAASRPVRLHITPLNGGFDKGTLLVFEPLNDVPAKSRNGNGASSNGNSARAKSAAKSVAKSAKKNGSRAKAGVKRK